MRKASLYIMALLYITAGCNHFINPKFYLRIIPPWVSAHEAMVLISGIAEVALGILLLPMHTRRIAAWGIVALLIAIFPANIQMAIDWHRTDHQSQWIAWLRLPMQAVLIWWALTYTKYRKY